MSPRKKICVIDGQGGGIGATLIKHIQSRYPGEMEILALGTNAIATAQMMKAGANRGASGENAIVRTVSRSDLIVGRKPSPPAAPPKFSSPYPRKTSPWSVLQRNLCPTWSSRP